MLCLPHCNTAAPLPDANDRAEDDESFRPSQGGEGVEGEGEAAARQYADDDADEEADEQDEQGDEEDDALYPPGDLAICAANDVSGVVQAGGR
jgi:hypothetical protein